MRDYSSSDYEVISQEEADHLNHYQQDNYEKFDQLKKKLNAASPSRRGKLSKK